MTSVDHSRLDFLQNLEYKFVQLLRISFVRSSDDTVQSHIIFRYNSAKQRLAAAQTQLNEITNFVKVKNPSLLLQLAKHQLQAGTSQLAAIATSDADAHRVGGA